MTNSPCRGLVLLLLNVVLRGAAGCADGRVACPAGTNSSGVCVPTTAPWCDLPLYRNPFGGPTERSEDLVGRLTLQQVVNLLQTTPVGGSNAVPGLGVDDYGTTECLHGYCGRTPSTLFPQSTTLAASFNPDLVQRVAAAIGLEARAWRNAWAAAGNASAPPPSLTCFAPQINIVRDPRWGRAQETYGEDSHLTATLAAAYVRGLQGGGGGGGGYLLAAATAKHFVAYQGATTRGQRSPTEVFLSPRDLMDTYEVAWRAAVAAGAASVMCAYSSLCPDDTNTTCALPPPAGFGASHGVPMCAHEEALGWLRRGAGGAAPAWDGVVAGDCGAVQFIQTDHLWADSQAGAAAAAVRAGTDFDCSISVGNGFAALPNATAAGLVSEAAVRAAGARVARLLLSLGLLDPPDMVPWASVPPSVINSAVHRGLAAAAARQGVVLLANGRGALPLAAAAVCGAAAPPGALLVTGPNADAVLSGNYNTQTDVNVTALGGLRARCGAAAVAFAPGCTSVAGNDTSGIAAAVAAARTAAIVVAVMGLDGTVEFEDSTRDGLGLPGEQEALLAALAGVGTPVVLVLAGGSGVAPSPAALSRAAAVLWVGYGGEEAGTALADVLLGAFNPGGRMPFTSFADAAHLPPYANMSMVGAPYGRTYRYYSGPAPTFAFGAGGSYSTMATAGVAAAVLPAPNASGGGFGPCDALRVTAAVSNAGPLDGDEVTQVYVRVRGSGHVAPRLALAAFARTPLVAGAPPTRVAFTLPPRAFAVVDAGAGGAAAQPQWVVGGATVGVFVGSNQPSDADWGGPQALELPLGGPARPLASCPGGGD